MSRMLTSRREFVLGSTGSLFAAAALRSQTPMTAQQIVDRLRADLGAAPTGNTVDGFKAGKPSTVITGIVTTTMATIDDIRTAAEARLVITYEPVFYTANDDPGTRASDPVYLAKKKVIDDRRLVVYRLFDHWNANRSNVFADQTARAFHGIPIAGADRIYEVPETTLGALAETNRPGVRVVGDRSMRVRRVFVSAGTTTLAATMAGLRVADVVIAGEPREWEAVPYVLDCIAAGQSKGMLLLGRIVSEYAGVIMSDWVKNVVPQLPVGWAGGRDPYWKP